MTRNTQYGLLYTLRCHLKQIISFLVAQPEYKGSLWPAYDCNKNGHFAGHRESQIPFTLNQKCLLIIRNSLSENMWGKVIEMIFNCALSSLRGSWEIEHLCNVVLSHLCHIYVCDLITTKASTDISHSNKKLLVFHVSRLIECHNRQNLSCVWKFNLCLCTQNMTNRLSFMFSSWMWFLLSILLKL